MSELTKAIGKPVGIAVGVVVVVGLAWLLFGKALKRAAAGVGTALNVTSDQNVAYRGVNAIGAALSNDENFTVGGAVFRLFPPKDELLIERLKQIPPDERTWYESLIVRIGG